MSTGKIINITNRLNREPRFICIGEKNYKVNCSKNAVLEVMELQTNGGAELETIDKILKVLLGSEAFRELEDMELPYDNWQVIFIATLACAMNKTYEEIDESFREATEEHK